MDPEVQGTVHCDDNSVFFSFFFKATCRESCVNDLKQLMQSHGVDVLVFVIHCVVKDGGSSPFKGQVAQLLVQSFDKQKLAAVVLKVVQALLPKSPAESVQSMLKVMKLGADAEIALLTSVASVESAAQKEAVEHVRNRVENKEVLAQCSLSTFHGLLALVQEQEGFTETEETAVLEALKKAHPSAGSTQLMYPLLLRSRVPGVLPIVPGSSSRLNKRLSAATLSRLRASVSVADLMEDLGYASAATTENLRLVFGQFASLKPQDVARIIGMMSRTHTGLEESAMVHTFSKNSSWNAKPGLKTWNVNVFVDTVKEMYPKLNWQSVIQGLDHPEFQLYDGRGFALILSVHRRATKAQFPVEALFGVWSNTSVQLSMLKLAVNTPPDVFSFYCLPPVAHLESYPHSIRSAINSQIQHWFCVPLIQTLLGLSEVENYSLVRLIFDQSIKSCPELLFLGLTQIKKRNALHVELCDLLMGVFLAKHANSAWVLSRVWNQGGAPTESSKLEEQTHRAIVVRGMVQAFNRDPTMLPRLLDISQMTLKSLTIILQTRHYSFALALATLAKHREFLSLGRWLPQRIQDGKDEFVVACIHFISTNTLAPEILAIFIKSITAHYNMLSPQVQEAVKQLQTSLAASEPSTAAAAAQGQGSGNGQSASSTSAAAAAAAVNQREVFAPHIEKRANSLFQQIYTGQVTIDEAIKLLQQFKESTGDNHEVFACMLHSLFDEFRFFASYPDKELQITGILFGKLIQNQLITNIPLGIAFRYVLEALKKPANSKMFKFGVLALDQFKSRLHEWPQYCAFLSQIPHLRQYNPMLMEWVDRAKGSATTPVDDKDPSKDRSAELQDPAIVSAAGGGSLQPSLTPGITSLSSPSMTLAKPADTPPQPHLVSQQQQQKATVAAFKPTGHKALGKSSDGGSTFSNLPLDLLLSSAIPIQEPVEKVKDRIHFIFNNVTVSNVQVKAKEMRELVSDEHEAYLARYIVVKRAAIEPNFQTLYVTFMDALVSVVPGLLSAVLEETFRNVRVLIDSEDIASSSAQRTILKNLGSWLGKLTIAKDRPLLYKDLCPKKLILQAYETGKLIVVVPFVAKILAAAADSKVFKPPNAWTMAQLRVLIELYNLPDLKLILKFETEVLCNHLSVDQSDIRPTQLFVNRPEPPAAAAPPKAAPQQAVAPGADKVVTNLESFIRIPPTATIIVQNPHLQRLVPNAMEAAIREIIQPVVERSVTIACVTTRELVTLDFATEGDEERLRQAARVMVRSLSGSLAGVTCAEPVRVSMTNHLKALLQANMSSKDHVQALDQAVALVVQENLELACALIEKAATEKAVREVEEALLSAYNQRQQWPKSKPYVDPAYLDNFPPVVPPSLRATPGGLSSAEYRVYEDFAQLPMSFDKFRTLPELHSDVLNATPGVPTPGSSTSSSTTPGSSNSSLPQAISKGAEGSTTPKVPSGQQSPAVVTSSQEQSPRTAVPPQSSLDAVVESFKTVVQELDKIFVGYGDGPINLLPQTEITNLVRQIPLLIVNSGDNSPKYAVTFAQVLFTRLFENSSPIFQEIQLVCLKGIRDVAVHITKDITSWVMLLSEEHAHNYKAILGLIRFQLIQVNIYDAHLAKMLVNGTQKTLELAIYLVKNCCLEGRYAATLAAEFGRTIAVLRNVQGIEGVTQMLDRIQSHQQAASSGASNTNGASPTPAQQGNHGGRSEEEGQVAQRVEESISPQLREKVTAFFSQWVRTLFGIESDRKDPETCLAILRSIGRSNPELASIINAQNLPHLVHVCTSSVVNTAYGLTQQGAVTTSWYKYVDSLTPLLVLLVRHAQPGEDLVMPRGESPAKLLIRRLTVVLNVIVKMIIRDHARGPEFRQRVHFRILISLIVMLNSSMNVAGAEESEEIKALRLQTALVFGDALLLLSPTRLPGFVFAWLELLSHRCILPTLLLSPRREVGWPQFQKLMLELFRFLQPYLRSVELADPIRLLYRGTLRVLLVLLHDFPEFLCEYYFGFCDYIPSTCVQMRNLILSAFPRNMQQPDPFQADLVIERLPSVQLAPTIRSDYLATLGRYPTYAKALNIQLSGKSSTFLRDAQSMLLLESEEAAAQDTRYNLPLINATVLLCGVAATQQPQSKGYPQSHPPSLEVLSWLVTELDPEGRYAVLNAIANQLRYPNRHTLYFSSVMLYLFPRAQGKDMVQEQMARVLLERLICNRPYPWGLLHTFIELLKKEKDAFDSLNFPSEIQLLFDGLRARVGSGGTAAANTTANVNQSDKK